MLPCAISHKTALIIKIKNDISFDRIPAIEPIFKEIRVNDQKVLAFDMSDIDYIDFSGLAFLLEASFRCKFVDIEMIVFGVSPAIMEIMKLSTVDTMLTIISKRRIQDSL